MYEEDIIEGAGSRPRSIGLLLTALSIATCTASLSQAMVIPLLPRIQSDLGLSPTAVTWALTGYLLAAAVATPVLGRLADIHGKRAVLMGALVVTMVGALICGIGHSPVALIGGRVLQGSMTAVYPMALALVRDEVPLHRLRASISTVSAVFAAGGGAGLIVASVVAEVTTGYQVAFVGLAVLVLISTVLVFLAVPESPLRTRASIDVVGGVLLATWLAALLLAVTEGHPWGWSDPRILGLFAITAVAATVWWIVESRTAMPLVDTAVFVRPGVLIANVGQLLVGFTSFLAFIEISDFVQTPSASGYGFSASVLGASVFLLPWTVTSVVGRPLVTRLLSRVGLDTMLAAGALIVAASFVYLALRHGAVDVYIASGGAGLGIGTTSVVIPIMVVEGAPQSQMGVATSMNIIARNVGGAIGAAVAGALLAVAGTSAARVGYPDVSGYNAGFLAGGATCLVLVLVIVARTPRLRGRRRQVPLPHEA
ncbi:MAG TPA: MFS transporter [Candidatus Dormibacteraeota bacterium]|jgi:MFS family permease|nr:MFS transporter [Candidatus Dormibacteraeota bacterium]